ncbi:MAG: hypothetical protein Q8P13_02585 [bacterium]|nr:hypothetical protein [bacterium]
MVKTATKKPVGKKARKAVSRVAGRKIRVQRKPKVYLNVGIEVFSEEDGSLVRAALPKPVPEVLAAGKILRRAKQYAKKLCKERGRTFAKVGIRYITPVSSPSGIVRSPRSHKGGP